MILYEYPINESIRTMLRLEHLFDRLGQLIPRTAALDHHFALQTLFEIIEVAGRADLKSDLLKELERHKSLMGAYRGNPAISEVALDQILDRIDQTHTRLLDMTGKAGQDLVVYDWLMSVRTRISIPGGTCEFDLPIYHFWLNQAPVKRQTDLQHWMTSFLPLAEALSISLGLLRDSGYPQMVVATNGQFQQSLSASRSVQLLRVRLSKELNAIPEISGHRLMVCIRLLRMDDEHRLKAIDEEVPFELTLCI